MRESSSATSLIDSLSSWQWPAGAMSLPVSSYEDLLARVRDLTLETRRLQEQLEETPTLSTSLNSSQPSPRTPSRYERVNGSRGGRGAESRSGARNSWPAAPPPRSLPLHSTTAAAARVLLGGDSRTNSCAWDEAWTNGRSRKNKGRRSPQLLGDSLITPPAKDDDMEHLKQNSQASKANQDGLLNGRLTSNGAQSHTSSSSLEDDNQDASIGNGNPSSLYHGAWPVDRSLWHSGPSSLGGGQQDVASVMSFASSVGAVSEPGAAVSARRSYSQQTLGPKVEMVYGLLSMLGSHNKEEMSLTLLAMSSSPDSCIAMRQSGCLPLLVQLLHGDESLQTRQRAAKALHNLVHSHPDDKRGRREARVLRLLEQVRDYCELLPSQVIVELVSEDEDDPKKHPGPTVAALMKLSFDEEHRHAMCQLGGLHAVAQLIQADHEAHGSDSSDQYCITLRRYAGMGLTNLTFGDGTNKALLCSFRGFMQALVAQLASPSEDLRQVTASVLRNLSWRADTASKGTLREVGAVRGLMEASMEAKKESTLKSILSALWNLSAHCSTNKAEICQVEGALAFLVQMLTYKSPSQTLAIVENSGGILRNISSHVAVREDYRAVLRDHGCLQVLLHQLKSPSLTVVSNACGTLWNLSARCPEDQRALWEMGAVGMLKSLVNSKHKMISMGSSAALKNLLGARPPGSTPLEQRNSQGMPVLSVRKQRALEQELEHELSETCDNIEPTSPSRTSPLSRDDKYVFATTEKIFDRRQRMYQSANSTPGGYGRRMPRSDSRESVKSDSVCERARFQKRPLTANRSLDLQLAQETNPQQVVTVTTGSHSEGASPDDEEPVSLKEQVAVDDKEKSPEVRPPKYQNYVYEEDEYQPVNYGLQYTEKPDEAARRFGARNYGTYAETDLDNPDQPTNYSLRYGEEEEDEEEKSPSGTYYRHSAVHEDSVKTYYTEGTPLNFSTATSMSDLREAMMKEKQEELKEEADEDEEEETASKGAPSGEMSPEKPTQYCVEDTPVCFSRVSSLSSLHCSEGVPESIPEQQPQEEEEVKVPEPEVSSPPKTSPEKVLETPLVFSRCSSVASLTSFEQHSIHDDRSSIVSDFSRLTSGMVSPSELPDSPTQTQPSSPRTPKAPVAIPATSTPRAAPRAGPSQPQPTPRTKVLDGEDDEEKQDKEKELATVSEEEEVGDEDDGGLLDACISSGQQRIRAAAPRPRFLRPRPSGLPTRIPRRLPRLQPAANDVCADAVQTFYTEDTPAISHAGSHSDLSVLSHRESAEGDSIVDDRPRNASTREESDDSSFSGDNEHILAECIQSGMPKAKESVKRKRTPRALPSRDETQTFAIEGTPFGLSNATSLSDLTMNSSARIGDGQCYTPIRYATEDTPANFSHASSLSSLHIDEGDVCKPTAEAWALSRPGAAAASSASEEVITVVSRNGSLSSLSVESLGAEPSASEQALLEQCISMGMSKGKGDLARTKQQDKNKAPKSEPSKDADCLTPTNPPTSEIFTETAKEAIEVPEVPVVETSSSSSKTTPEEAVAPAKVMTDTWTEDSPLSVSFPSLSGSVPMASSQDEEKLEDKFIISHSLEGILELEAGRVMRAIADEASSESLLEVTRPPPNMFGSTLSTSLSNGRVPAVVLRALNGESLDHIMLSGSSSCTSLLGNVKPPAAFDEIDMENSMISVASISSEVAGDLLKASSVESDNMFDLMRPAANMAEIYCRAAYAAANAHSFSENLDSINPPSMLFELTETLEPGSETMGSDTEPEDLPADQSAESTPKLNRRPTPKERRLAMKERYNTYTIDDEVSKRPDRLELQNKTCRQRRQEEPARYLTQTIEAPPQLLTPKQRRQEDKVRYLTQTVQLPVEPKPAPVEPSDHESEEEAKPKIVKPAEESSPKGIRGRRKPLYSRPTSVPKPPPVVTPKGFGGPPIRPTRASALRQRSSSPRAHSAPTPKKNTTPVATPGASRTPKTPGTPATQRTLVTQKTQKPPIGKTAPTAAKTPKPPNNSPKVAEAPKLVKQGTFTKESTDSKGSRIPVRSPSADTLYAAPALVRPQLSAPKSRGLVRRDAVGPSGVQKATPPKPRSPLASRRVLGGLKTSLSNNSIQGEVSSSPLKVKTNSNPSLAPGGTKKKEVTSKIASLWKRVEDSRLQQKYGAKFGPKDTRVWITPENDEPQAGDSKSPQRNGTVFEKPTPGGRLSIFNGGPSKAAIVPPFNYSPPPPPAAGAKEEAAAGAGSVRVTSV